VVTLVLAWNQDCDRNMGFGFVIVKFALLKPAEDEKTKIAIVSVID